MPRLSPGPGVHAGLLTGFRAQCTSWAPKLAGFGACLLLGCGGSQPAAAPPTPPAASDARTSEPAPELSTDEDPKAPPEPLQGTARLEDQWWTAEPRGCPEGSTFVGAAPPEGDQVGCRNDKGKNVGPATRFYPNGQKREEGRYDDNLAVGTWTVWDPSGQKLSETPYVRGKKEGLLTELYPDGTVKAQRHYVDGKRHGMTRLWDESGQKRTAQPYENAQEHGLAAFWDERGELAKLVQWRDGRAVRTVRYRRGRPVRE